MTIDLAIVGGGPYALSLASHAKTSGLNYELIGYPMEFWQKKMPPNMFIRTELQYTGLSDPEDQFTLDEYARDKGIELEFPLPRPVFVDYGFWFVKKTEIQVTADYVTSIFKEGEIFKITTQKGKVIYSRCVVVAVGLTKAKYIPENLSSQPEKFVTHSSDHTAFNTFQGKRVLVLGGGQSAWETAALLNQSNATVDLVYRRSSRIRPRKGMNAKQQHLADKFFYMNPNEKEKIRTELRVPTVSDFLVPMVEDKVRQYPNNSIREVSQTNDRRLALTLKHGEKMIVDHIIAATGFQYSLDRLSFLEPIISDIARNQDGTPKVNEFFQSDLQGLYFAGPATAYNHGPTYHFVAGVWQTAKNMIPAIKESIYRIS